MKKYLILLLISCFSKSAETQNYLHLTGGYSYINPTEWNKTIGAYNFARPWLSKELPALHSGFSSSLGFSGVIGQGLFITPEFNFTRYTTSASNDPASTVVKLNWVRGQIYLDLYPREFGVDSVAFSVRPFVRLGGGASALLPRVTINDSLATVDDENYDPIIWTYQFSAGIGCRFEVAKHIDLIPMILFHFQPAVHLEDFSYALHGTQIPALTDHQKLNNLQLLLTLSIRLGRNDEDSEE